MMTPNEEKEAIEAIRESVEEVIKLLKQLPTNANRQLACLSLERAKTWMAVDVNRTTG